MDPYEGHLHTFGNCTGYADLQANDRHRLFIITNEYKIKKLHCFTNT